MKKSYKYLLIIAVVGLLIWLFKKDKIKAVVANSEVFSKNQPTSYLPITEKNKIIIAIAGISKAEGRSMNYEEYTDINHLSAGEPLEFFNHLLP